MRLIDCTRLQKRFLSRHICWLCELPLDRDWCGAIGERCPQAVIEQRRADCLATYKPRAKVQPRGHSTGARHDRTALHRHRTDCRELERRGPFPDAEAAEAMAMQLLNVLRVLAPYDGQAAPDRKQQRR